MARRRAKKPRPIKFEAETVAIATLTPHPRNYRDHEEDQLEHLKESIKEHGYYRNVVIAKDGTILAGHGVVEAATKLGLKEIPVIRLDVGPNDPKALKVMVGDNEIAKLATINDRALTEILKEILDVDLDGLIGTGYDGQMLAALTYVSRPASEIADMDEAAEWAGMPEFEAKPSPLKIVIAFRNPEDRERFAKKYDIKFVKKETRTWSSWWPAKDRQDLRSLQFEG